jgi:thymidylate kinase
MAADIAEDIAEKKEQGQTIIIDRSPLTYIAYNAFGSQLKDEQLAYDACEAVCDSWLIDKLVLLNAPQRLLDSRRQKRQTSDYFEAKDEAYHSRVRRGYEAGRLFLSQHPKIGRRVVQIDASGTIEEIHQQVLAAIEL